MSNSVVLQGNLTADPEVRHTQTGKTVANFRMATNERYRDKEGEWHEKSQFHNVTSWNQAAAVGELRKGKGVMVIGQLQTRTYEDQAGKTRYITEVVASCVGQSLPFAKQNTPPAEQPAEEAPPAADFDAETGF